MKKAKKAGCVLALFSSLAAIFVYLEISREFFSDGLAFGSKIFTLMAVTPAAIFAIIALPLSMYLLLPDDKGK